MPDEAPLIVQKLGINVTPWDHGIWCSIAGGPPFVNEIVVRRWSEDGRRISIMLDSLNFDEFAPDEMVSVVELGRRPHQSDEAVERRAKENAAFASLRPDSSPHNQGTGTDVY